MSCASCKFATIEHRNYVYCYKKCKRIQLSKPLKCNSYFRVATNTPPKNNSILNYIKRIESICK
jgi:hypothetical protein